MADDIFSEADALDGLSTRLSHLDEITQQFGKSLSRALATGIAQGRSFDTILQTLGQKLIEISLRAAFRPLETALSGSISSLFGAFTGGFTGTGGLFADMFGSADTSGTDLFGAPVRGAGSGAVQGVSVTMHVSTPDADSFRRSEAQVSSALARAVARGQRNL
ncbi:MAG TPA: hypothetical protein PKW21_01910 [Rhabdaerophilum sp.]|nr:hypothetical protein [Rhabdaerophilum sp.]